MATSFDGTLANLLDGPAHILLAPGTETRPTKIADIFAPVDQTLTGNWFYGGYTDGGISYARGMESNEYEVDQVTLAVLEKITQTIRSLTVNFSEHTADLTKIIEEGSAVETVAAAAGSASQEVVHAGSVDSLTQHRAAVVLERDEGFGSVVTLPDTTTRGSLVVLTGLVTLAAEDSEVSMEKASLVNRPVQFRFQRDPAESDPAKAQVSFFYEQAETIAA